jgi:serine protease Do
MLHPALRRARSIVLFALTLLLATPALGQERGQEEERKPRRDRQRSNWSFVPQWLRNAGGDGERAPGVYERRHTSVVAAFREIVANPAKSTVEVATEVETVALGTIVSADGFILTKGSDLKGKIACTLSDKRRFDAELIGVNKQHDLALLKIGAADLTPIVWSEAAEIPVGSWLATTGLANDPVSIGVLSAAARAIAAPRPILGVLLAQAELGARIENVMEKSGAAKAELKVGDVICGLNGDEIKSRESLIERIGKMEPGDQVKLKIKRGEEDLEIEATLGPNDEMDAEINRHEFQNQLGGELSRRRAGFPAVFQHDTVLRPNECGGPVVDLDGRAVGINIARAGRVASYAIPTATVKEVLAALMNARPVSLEEMH